MIHAQRVFILLAAILCFTAASLNNFASAQIFCGGVNVTKDKCTSPLCGFTDLMGCYLLPCVSRSYGNCTDLRNTSDTCFGYSSKCMNCDLISASGTATASTCPTGCDAVYSTTGAISKCNRKCSTFAATECTTTTDRQARCQVGSQGGTNTAAGSSPSSTYTWCTDIPVCTTTEAAACTRTSGCAYNGLAQKCQNTCYMLYTEALCKAQAQCTWNVNATQKCSATPLEKCESVGTAEQCQTAIPGCTWNYTGSTCAITPCSGRTTELACTNTALSVQALGCSWNATAKSCSIRPPTTTTAAPTTKPTTTASVASTCSSLSVAQCTSATATAGSSLSQNCFVYMQKCVSCKEQTDTTGATTSTNCNTDICDMVGTVCVRGCSTYDSATCQNMTRCQVYQPAPNVRSTLQCTTRPRCGDLYKNNATACAVDENCQFNTATNLCVNGCAGWKNSQDCVALKVCVWDATTATCQAPTTSTTVKPTETSTVTKQTETSTASTTQASTVDPTTCSGFTTADLCKSAAAVKMGCYMMGTVCTSCKEQTADACDANNCETVLRAKCLPKCSSQFNNCPTAYCQIATPPPGTNTLVATCASLPPCPQATTQTVCEAFKESCLWQASNPASAGITVGQCVNLCSTLKNADNCKLAGDRCAWNTDKNVCGDNTAATTTVAPTKPTVTADTTSSGIVTKPTVTVLPTSTAEPKSCDDIKEPRVCVAYAAKWACAWNLRAAACISRPCTNRTGDLCMVGDGQDRGCFLIKNQYCSSCNARECDSRVCQVDAAGTCAKHCWTYENADDCNNAEGTSCMWNKTLTTCVKYVAATPIVPPVRPPTYVACPDRDSSSCEVTANTATTSSNNLAGAANTVAVDIKCVWSQTDGVCKYPTCDQYSADQCPDRCQVKAVQSATATGTFTKQCAARCPVEFPVFCESTNVCAASLDKCQKCGSSQVLCWNSKCANSLTECDCPTASAVRCPSNNKCVQTKDACEAINTCDGVTCWDGSCITSKFSVDPATGAQTLNSCPCPTSTPFRCTDGTCARGQDACSVQCAEPTPYKCWNGACATGLAACPCGTEKPVRCSTDNSCAASLADCQCPSGTEKCADVAPVAGAAVSSSSTAIKCAKIGSCGVQCPQDKPVRCEFGVGTDACADSADACPCPDSAWANAVVVAQIQALATTTVDVTAGNTHRVSASALAYVCRSKRDMTARFSWRLVDITGDSKTVIKLPSGNVGSVLDVDVSVLTPGHTYTLSVVATLVRRELSLDTAPSATASITFTAAKKRPEVLILGGAERQQGNQDSSLTVAVDPRRLGADVSATGAFTNVPTVSWSCSCADNTCTACPAIITNALSQGTGAKIEIDTTTNKIPAGTYNIKAQIQVCSATPAAATTAGSAATTTNANNCDTVSASQTVIVQPAGVSAKAAQVGIFGVPSTETLLSATRTITLYARSNVEDASKLSWTVNGNNAGTGNSLDFAASSLTAGMTYNVVVTATAADGTTATAKASFTVPTKIAGSCSISVSSSSDSSNTVSAAASTNVVSMETPLQISTSWKGVDASSLRFRFGYFLNSGTVWLSDAVSELSSMNIIAPMVTGDSTRPVKFVVVARLDGHKEDLASTTCDITITPATTTKAADAVSKAWERIQDSKQTNDTSRLATVVANLAGAAKTLTNSGDKKNAQALAVRAVETIANMTDADKLSRAQRSTIIQGLRAAVDSEQNTSASVNTNTDTNSQNRKGQVTKMNTTMQEVAIRSILRAVTTPKQGADDKDSLDSRNDARSALSLLSNLTIKNKEIADAAVAVARNLGAQGDLGKKIEEKFENISVSAVNLPGDKNNRFILNATNSSIAFPTGFSKFSDETSRYSVSATEFKQNLLGTAGAPDKKKIASAVVDFLVQTNGQQEKINGTSQPIEIQIKLSAEVLDALAKLRQKQATTTTTAAPSSTSSTSSTSSNTNNKDTIGAECKYFDETKQQWSSQGVTTRGVNEKDGTVQCDTTHMSTYTVFVNEGLTTTSDPSTTTTNNNGAATDTSSGLTSGQRTALIAGVIGGVALLVAAALFVRARNSRGTGYKGDVSQEDNLNHLLFAAPQVEYDDHEMIGGNNKNKGEFSNL